MKKSELPVWDLSRFYLSPSDPQIEKDMKRLAKGYQAFQKKYKNTVSTLSSSEIENALTELQKLNVKQYRRSLCLPGFFQ